LIEHLALHGAAFSAFAASFTPARHLLASLTAWRRQQSMKIEKRKWRKSVSVSKYRNQYQ
jgi:hypothetical protein